MKQGLNTVDIYTYEDSDVIAGKNKKFLEEQDQISIDTWKPTITPSHIIQSDWRKKEIGDNFDGRPSLDDLLKIRKHLKRLVPDYQIMQTFGISANTLMAIKRDKYCPVDGILTDNFMTQLEEFKKQISSDFRETRRKVTALEKRISTLAAMMNLSEANKSVNA